MPYNKSKVILHKNVLSSPLKDYFLELTKKLNIDWMFQPTKDDDKSHKKFEAKKFHIHQNWKGLYPSRVYITAEKDNNIGSFNKIIYEQENNMLATYLKEKNK